MRIGLLVLVCWCLPFLSQARVSAIPVEELFSDSLKAQFLEKLFERDELVAVMQDSLLVIQNESVEDRDKRRERIIIADSLNHQLVDRFIELYGFSYNTSWSNKAKNALIKIIHRSRDMRFRLKHFPLLRKVFYEGKIEQSLMTHYLCRTLQDNPAEEEACYNRDLDKLFKKVKKMYDRYYWWK